MTDQEKVEKHERRKRVRKAFEEKKFKLTTSKEKADEFQHESVDFLYFYWKQGNDLNIAIDPRIEYSRLLKLDGVSLQRTRPQPEGLRSGTAMTIFPDKYKSFVPKDSHVGRMFSVREEVLSVFLDALSALFAPPHRDVGEPVISTEKTSRIPQFPDDPLKRKRVPISPEEDEQRRKKQAENGALGEILAKQYEIARLGGLFCPDPEAHVDHVALRDTGAGYDLKSTWNDETRCIEVKASESRVDSFFISSNEVETLSALRERGWIYLVDLSKKDDLLNCVTPVSNAGAKLALEGVLKPTQFRATLRG